MPLQRKHGNKPPKMQNEEFNAKALGRKDARIFNTMSHRLKNPEKLDIVDASDIYKHV